MSCHAAWVYTDPFQGLAPSIVTSNVVDVRDAVQWTTSWYTTSGSVSTHTLQLSNHSAERPDDPTNASFVNFVAFGTGTPAVIEPPAGVRWARFLRTVSDASVQLDVNKQVG
jgi:hypothetical protein